MKRSQIDACIQEFLDFAESQGFYLPPWARYGPQQWAELGPEADEIRRCKLGWDVTDFGSGRFDETGLALFTLRNGLPGRSAPEAKDYCEKIMMVREGQLTPYHFHSAKMEDIINRAGGRLVVRLYRSTPDGQLDEQSELHVQADGITRTLPPGGQLVLAPGESVTLPPRLYHAFWGAPGTGSVLVGEVSRVNDDARDNHFLEPLPRFPEIEEDIPARFVLCTEYPPPR
ncbi:MAG: D-lyxose/D-mannose family sugar isomerase [Planctomycetales bacterium 4484_123]|nr:MAG: D-lyxose/D-mannose family sugar isomerase [Planctomycetales bacterium 4484_123]